MRAHIIENGLIINTIVVESLDFMPGLIAAVGDEGSGWTYDGRIFSPPSPLPPVVPESVTRSQGKMALLHAGLLQQVEAFIETIEDADLQMMARIAFTDAGIWERSSPALNALAYGLGLDDLALDTLFIAAAEVRL